MVSIRKIKAKKDRVVFRISISKGKTYLQELSCLLIILAYSSQPLFAIDINSTGNAYDISTEQLVYTENHSTLVKEDGKHQLLSIYRDPKGDEICKRSVLFKNGKVVEYILRQSSARYSESVIRTRDSIEISINNSARIKQKIIPVEENSEVVIDAGFSPFIVRNWAALMAGETLKFNFVSVSRMSIVGLQISKTAQSEKTIEFAMTASNPIIRMLMTPIIVKYSVGDKQLAYYKGVSNLKDSQGENYEVEISFNM